MARKNDDVESSNSVESSGQFVGFVDQNRFCDDFDVDMYFLSLSRQIEREREDLNPSTPLSDGVHQRSRRSDEDDVDFSDVKEIPVDTFVVSQNATELAKTPPPPPSAPSSYSKRRSFQSVGKNVKVEAPTNIESDKVRSYPPPPPLLPPPTELRSHHKHKTLERKVSDVATAISTLYNKRKRRNKRKLRNISESSVRLPEIEQPRQTIAPPPPPPPSVFQNLFKKGGKHKRIHSFSATVPPPPPPPPPPRPSSIFNNIFKSGSKSERFHSPSPPSSIMNSLFKNGTKSDRFNYINAASSAPRLEPQIRRCTSKGKPPLPTKTGSYYERDGFLTSGSQSPLIPIPPPPPPFKMSAMKFEVRGDFVKIQSSHSSVCSSPDHDAVDLSSKIKECGDSSIGLISFPSSPDVNAKADTFISRLKDEWRMEKINYYVKDKMG
ncbi:hypothetical protein L1987_50183 [Smallanthus sonchifolius]|uniref:Uncharacterized protein n=1 Tax=Smallanthus sonchifolius TaxID=185202 RepID=A0ACB9FXC4_9ASTR|nr:hypothetical protein L1987_50183 [Smallanthus sonchifolius]